MNQDDDTPHFILALVGAVVMGIIALVIGVSMHSMNAKRAKVADAMPVPAAAIAPVSAAAAAADMARVAVEGGVVKFYFASGKTDVAPNAAQALVDVVKGVASGKKAVVSGFADASGDAVKNAELSKLRAFAVRDSLKAIGVDEAKIELRKPAAITANAVGSSSDARRVDVTLE